MTYILVCAALIAPSLLAVATDFITRKISKKPDMIVIDVGTAERV
jgi:hypothetical protein